MTVAAHRFCFPNRHGVLQPRGMVLWGCDRRRFFSAITKRLGEDRHGKQAIFASPRLPRPAFTEFLQLCARPQRALSSPRDLLLNEAGQWGPMGRSFHRRLHVGGAQKKDCFQMIPRYTLLGGIWELLTGVSSFPDAAFDGVVMMTIRPSSWSGRHGSLCGSEKIDREWKLKMCIARLCLIFFSH